ncbi:lactonase family protein [Agromyces sp. SYSU T00194]|uniref:lactonase family protein n=1 Tax=Agromyces chitinivorans TaxID=3158560 RepID=UPI00339A7C8F
MSTSATPSFWLGASTSGILGSPAAGIRPVTVDGAGALTLGDPVDVGPDPMYLARHGDTLVVAHHLDAGAVSAHRLGADGPEPLGERQATLGADSCHVSVHPDGRWAYVADYTSGSLSVHPLGPGGVGPQHLRVAYAGSGPDASRQEAPHAHQAVVDAARGRLLVVDLGADRLRGHDLAALAAGDDAHGDVHLRPGSGPRHLVVLGRHAVVAYELDGTLGMVDLDAPEAGETTAIVSTMAGRDAATSAIRRAPNGLLAVANRTPNTVSTIRADDAAGTLELLDEHPVAGDHPRDIEFTADGRFLVIANQASDSLSVVAVDPESGRMSPVGDPVGTPSPACLLRMD